MKKEELVKEYLRLLELGYSHHKIQKNLIPCAEEIDCSIETIRKLAQKQKKIKFYNSNKEFEKIAKEKNNLLVQQKIIVKQKNLLHNDANILAWRNLVYDITKDFDWNYTPVEVIDKSKKSNFPVAYIISDEHYRGKIDDEHLINIYRTIKEDIKVNGYDDVELWYGADQIDGLIHLSSIGTNEGAIIPSLNYSKIVINEINSIPEVSRVVFVNKANHSEMRVLGTKRGELAKEDLGLVMEELFKNGLRKDIKFVSDEVINFEFSGKNIAIMHGCQSYCKSREKLMNYWSAKFGIIPDLFVLAHFHTFKVNEYGFNRYLAVMPSAKNWNGDYEKQNGFISTNQIVKLKWESDNPQWTIMKLK